MAYGLSDIVQQRRMIDKFEQLRRIQAGLDRQARCARWPGRNAALPAPAAASPISARSCMGEGCGNCDNCLTPPKMRDGKVLAQKLLSCVYRTGQRFGAMHLIDVLMGHLTEKVTQFGHDKLTVFGIGRDLNEKQWRTALRQLVAMGHLMSDSEAFGALKLTDSSRGVLRGETEVWLREEAPGTRISSSRANRAAAISRRRPRRRKAMSILNCAPGCEPGVRTLPANAGAGLRRAARRHHRRHRSRMADHAGRAAQRARHRRQEARALRRRAAADCQDALAAPHLLRHPGQAERRSGSVPRA